MISIIAGIIHDIILFTNIFTFVKSWFATSNLSSSNFSLLNARITPSPVSISLVTKFNLSTKLCNILNLGITTVNITKTIPKTHTTPRPIIQLIDRFVLKAFIIPPIAINGAKNTILSIITIICCICCMSLVLRVISDAVENLSNSTFEKLTTFLNTSLRRLRPIPAPTLEPINPTTIVANKLISAIPSIAAPDLNI